jgi:hypothetical protein
MISQHLELATAAWLHLINCWFKCPCWDCSCIMNALSNRAERFGPFFFGRVETFRTKSANLLVCFFYFTASSVHVSAVNGAWQD